MGGDRPIIRSYLMPKFQFTPPRGGRLSPIVYIGSGSVFQFTPPRGGRLFSFLIFSSGSLFQFTPPRGGRPKLQTYCIWLSNFNSRPRVGGDVLKRSIKMKFFISIHAPAWGATFPCIVDVTENLISIHAPAWGATPCTFNLHCRSHISIHAPAWGATYICFGGRCIELISIHAPAWGATAAQRAATGGEYISIHAPAWGATAAFTSRSVRFSFQFTPPRGGRQQKRTKSCCNDCAFCCISCLVSRERKTRGSFLFGLCSESPSKRCADLPKKCVRRRSARQRFTEAAAHRFRSVRCVR